ncbi:MAG: aldo/keto reductase [Ruminococcaceae bacterium]|nr:aldo/keto reductase [Oscillospiraceae bacterium]
MKITEKNRQKISEFTLGTVQLGIPYGIHNTHGMPTYEQSARILQTAINGGIVSFDTAQGYGKSESVLGRFFSENPAEKTLITKVQFENETRENIKDSLFAKVNASLSVLGLSALPFVLLHSQAYLETYGGALTDALLTLKKEGLVQGIGISFSDKTKLLEYADPAVFDCIQLPANMFDSKEIREGTIKAIGKSGIAVFVRSIYLQGLFFMDPAALPARIRSAKPLLEKLRLLAAENQMGMAELALSYMRGTEGVASLVLGCETVPQLSESLSLFHSPPLKAKIRDKVSEIAEEVEPVVIRPWEWNG